MTIQFFCRESEIVDVRKECSGLKQEIDRLDSERETLLSKIEAGDGVNGPATAEAAECKCNMGASSVEKPGLEATLSVLGLIIF